MSPEQIEEIYEWLIDNISNLPAIRFPTITGDLWFSVPDRVDIHYFFTLRYDPLSQEFTLNIYADFKNQSGENIGTYLYTVFALEGFTIHPKRPVARTNLGNSIEADYIDDREKIEPNTYYWESASPSYQLERPDFYYSFTFDQSEYPTDVQLGYYYETGRWGVDFAQMFTDGVDATVDIPLP